MDDYAHDELLKLHEDFTAPFQAKAGSARPGRILFLRQPRPDEIHGDGHVVARETIIGEWVDAP